MGMNANDGTMRTFADGLEAERAARSEGAALWHVGEEVEVKGDRYVVHRLTKKGIELRPIRGGRVPRVP